MKAKVDVVQITPAKAAEYLDNLFEGQRKVREDWVASLAEDMRAGRFRLSCDSIVLIKGKLGNGQHRLWAVVESGTTQPFILMRTDDEELYKVIDGGAKRSVGDALGIMSGGMCASIGNLVMGYDRKGLTYTSIVDKGTRIELIEFVEKHKEELLSAVHMSARLTSNHINLVSRSVVGAFLLLARRTHGTAADAFIGHVYSGDQPDDVTSVLRNRFIKVRVTSDAPLRSTYALALVIKAFNFYIKGTKVGALKLLDNETYPVLIEGPGV